MEELIKLAAQQLGASEDTAKTGLGSLLSILQSNTEEGDFSQLLGAIPGASDILQSFAGDAGGDAAGGGLAGGLLGAASALLGGNDNALGGILDAAQAFSKSGLDAGQFGGLADLFFDYIKDNIDGDLLQKLISNLPDIAKLAA